MNALINIYHLSINKDLSSELPVSILFYYLMKMFPNLIPIHNFEKVMFPNKMIGILVLGSISWYRNFKTSKFIQNFISKI